MRTNKFLPFFIALLIHVLPLAWFLVFKTHRSSSIAGGSSSSSKMGGIDLSGFSTSRRRKVVKLKSENKESKTEMAESAAPGTRSSAGIGGGSGARAGAGTGVGGTKSESRILSTAEPLYPPLARQKGLEGKVKLRAYYNIEGIITQIEVLETSGTKMLDESAKKALASWKLKPGEAGSFEKTFQFKLNN